MTRCNIFIGVFVCFLAFIVNENLADKMVSKGRWIVEKVSQCPDNDKYPYKMNIKKKKINRTHVAFDGDWDFPAEITNYNTGVYIETCKKVDGGCKLVQIFQDESFCAFVKKYAEENFKKFLVLAGLDGDCPIPKGQNKVSGFLFDNTELPQEGMVGSFQAIATFIVNKKKVCCLLVDLYLDTTDEDDCDDDYN